MKRSDLPNLILANAVAEVERLRALGWDGYYKAATGVDRTADARLRHALKDALAGVVEVRWPVLLGRPPADTAELRAAQRAMERLERDGQVKRLRDAAGRVAAIKLIAYAEAAGPVKQPGAVPAVGPGGYPSSAGGSSSEGLGTDAVCG